MCEFSLFGKQVLIFCYCVSERWSLELSLILVIVGEKKLYPPSQKTVSSLHCLFYAFSVLRRGEKKSVCP